MEGQQGIERKAEASPERTGGVTASKLSRTTEIDGIEDITASIATSALSCNAPKLDDGIDSNINSQTSKNGVDHGGKDDNAVDDEDETRSEDGKDWGNDEEHEDDEEHDDEYDDDDYDGSQDDSMDTGDNYDDEIFSDENADMGPPESEVEEHKHTFGSSEVTFKLFIQDNDDEFDDWMHTIHVQCSVAGKKIGRAFGR